MSTTAPSANNRDEFKDIVGHPQLLPVAPLIYAAWSDGVLTDEEISGLSSYASEQAWLDEEARKALISWLDPDTPPSPTRLAKLCRAINETAGEAERADALTLAELGARLASIHNQGQPPEWMSDSVKAALQEIEENLGFIPHDASRALLRPRRSGSAEAHFDEPPAAFEVSKMTEFLDGPWRSVWQKMRALLSSDKFKYLDDPSTETHREKVLDWLQILADEGLGQIAPGDAEPSDQQIGQSMGEFMAYFEALGMFDLSLAVKFGVQFGLFGGSILFLGTKAHHDKYLPDVSSLKLPGGFAMTERGHGSNVRDLRTTATFDPDTDEFIIHTPDDSAQKEWIGNAALHGQMMTVFAQLQTGGEDYGVHAFLVPIRHQDGSLHEGVRVKDCGHKMGLNGVDNGRIWFDKVRIPRENLLNRYADVSKNGTYSSPISSSGKRFFTMLGTLVAGRISVAASGLTATKSALAVATRYSAIRRQFGAAGRPEIAILDYPTHQQRLMPRIATTYALHFASEKLRQRYIDTRGQADTREVEAMAAAIKSFSSWHAIEAVQAARECCGGMGYLTENRIAPDRVDVDIFATFEGDNTVLMMLVARSLLSEYQQQFENATIFTLARFVAGQAANAIQRRNPLLTRDTDLNHLRDADFQLRVFKTREDDLLGSAAQRLKRRLDKGMDAFDAFNEVQVHMLNMAKAHAERLVMESFIEGVERAEDDDVKRALKTLRDLYAMEYLHRDIGWFMENGYVQPVKARAIRDLRDELCAEARQQALPLVNAWGIPDELLGAKIAFADYAAQ